jgi:hypothetical protein
MSDLEDFDSDLDAQLAAEPVTAVVDVLVNGKLRKLQFTEMEGLAWADLTDRCPPRVDAPLDRAYGFNIRLIVAHAAPLTGRMKSGDEWVKLTDAQWTKLLRGIKGAEQRTIGDALFQLNQWGPAQAVEAARKAFEGESATSSSLLDDSGSPVVD